MYQYAAQQYFQNHCFTGVFGYIVLIELNEILKLF